MSKWIWLPLVSFLLPALVQGQDEVKFKPVITPDAIRFVAAFSDDHQAATMIFDNFLASTRADKGELPDTTVKSFTYCLQPEITKPAVVVTTVRGYSSTQGTASAAVIVHAAGKTTTVKLQPDDKKYEASDKKPTKLEEKARQLAKDQGFEMEEPPSTSADYQHTFKTKVTPGKPLQITVILLVDRLPGDTDGALVTVDSIDFEISKE
jgi:hypothetical protein